MSKTRLKSNLYLVFRLSLVANFVYFVAFVFAAFYFRSRSKVLKDSLRTLAVANARLTLDYSRAVDYITNRYYSVSSAFASNVFASVSTQFVNRVSPVSSSSDSVKSDEMPPIQFNGYFEVNGSPRIRVRNKYYKEGDALLGFPIQFISPDVVVYREKYFKVDQ